MILTTLVAAALIATSCSGSSGSAPPSVPSVDDVSPQATSAASGPDVASDPEVIAEAQEPTTDPDTRTTRFATVDPSFLFDPDVVHTFDLGLDPAALDELDSDPAAEQYVEGSLSFDGETLDRIGVRYKGSIGAFLGCTSSPNSFVPTGPKTCTKLSFELKINWDGADTEFYGQRQNGCRPFSFGPMGILQRSAACDPLVSAWASLDREYATAEAEFRSGPFAPDNVRKLTDRWSAQIEPHVLEAPESRDDTPTVEQWQAAIDQLIQEFVVPGEQEN